jgi:sugar phosphate isomerase/epimerase
MDNFLRHVNDGSTRPPKLEIQQAWWAMIGLGNGEREWTMEEKFEKIAEAGFTGILGSVPEPKEAEKWRRLLDEYKFSFAVHSFPWNREDLRTLLRQAKEFGVQYVNSQVMDNFVIDDNAVKLLDGLVAEAAEANVPYFVETHRGRVTQDLHRTVDYIRSVPNLRLTVDFSHYVLAGEMGGYSEKAEPLFKQLLERTSCIHARVSNGEQIQVDIGPNGEHPMTEHYLRWWEEGIANWLDEAQPGDVLPFVSELGPPHYAITEQNFMKPHGKEISDRWKQALVFKRLAEQAWNNATTKKTK